MVSQTSVAVYHNEIKGLKEASQNMIVYNVLKNTSKAICMRAIQKLTGIEINALSRTLNNLVKLGLIEFFDAKSILTNRKVHHYLVKNNQLWEY